MCLTGCGRLSDHMGRATRMNWEQHSFDPIELPDGRALRGLRDAGESIQSLPAAVQHRPEWRTATEALLLVVGCNGDPMLARIGIARALYAGKAHRAARTAPQDHQALSVL